MTVLHIVGAHEDTSSWTGCTFPRGDCKTTTDIISIEIAGKTFHLDSTHPHSNGKDMHDTIKDPKDIYCLRGATFINCRDCFHPRFLHKASEKFASLKRSNEMFTHGLVHLVCGIFLTTLALGKNGMTEGLFRIFNMWLLLFLIGLLIYTLLSIYELVLQH